MLYYYVALGCAFLTVVSLITGIYYLVFNSRISVIERLNIHTSSAVGQQHSDTVRGKGAQKDFLILLGIIGKFFPSGSGKEKIQKKLLKAQILMRVEEFVGLSVFSGLGLFLLLYLLIGNIFAAIPFGLIGFKIPGLIVDMKKNKRTSDLNNQLPEALTIICNGLRARLSFPQAITVVNREMGAPLGDEFARVNRENRMGKPLEDVLLDLGERYESDDLKLVITALLIQKQVGGNLAEILDNISHTIRERIRIKSEIKTLTAQGRLSAIVIIMLPIGVGFFLVMINPEYMAKLVQETMGIIMLVSAIILQLIGIVVIRKIINIEV